jgi:XrtJ-associated TM-motif-TM protein
MRNSTFIYACVALFFALAVPLYAQTGCDDSPEDPTVVLALVSGAGVLGASVWRLRRKRD